MNRSKSTDLVPSRHPPKQLPQCWFSAPPGMKKETASYCASIRLFFAGVEAKFMVEALTGAGALRSRIYLAAFNSEYTIPTNRSALVPAPAGKSPPGTFAS